jgi:hypothetical protein
MIELIWLVNLSVQEKQKNKTLSFNFKRKSKILENSKRLEPDFLSWENIK